MYPNASVEQTFLLRSLSVFSEYRKKIAFIVILSSVLTLLYGFLLMDPIYKASVVILPNNEDKSLGLGGISNIASLIGVNVGGIGNDETMLYPDIIKSRRFLEPLLLKKFWVSDSRDSIPLITLLDFKFEGNDSVNYEKTLQKALRVIETSIIDVSVDKKTSLVTITVFIPKDKYVAANVANYLADQLGYYNRNVRLSKAKEQLSFIEKRLHEVTLALEKSENELTTFRENNRSIMNSPSLQLQLNRLMTTVEINKLVYGEFRKNLEIVKLEVVKTTPVINILDYAYPPSKKDKPSRLLMLAVALVGSFFCSLGFFFLRSEWIINKLLIEAWLESHTLGWLVSFGKRINIF